MRLFFFSKAGRSQEKEAVVEEEEKVERVNENPQTIKVRKREGRTSLCACKHETECDRVCTYYLDLVENH